MNETMKMNLHRFNKWLERPFIIIAVLIFLFGYFAYGNLQFAKQNRELILNTKQAVDNSNIIIKNLQVAVHDLKDDNERKTSIIICMLQVPLSQRTTDLENSCRAQAEVLMPTPKQSIQEVQVSPSQTPNTSNSSNNPDPTPEPKKPAKSLLCTITLTLLGCK